MKKVMILFLISMLLILSSFIYINYDKTKNETNNKKEIEEKILEINSHYNTFVKSKDDANLYDKDKKIIGTISNIELELEKIDIDENTNYFYIPNLDGYVYYEDVTAIEQISEESKEYKNYIPFSKKIILKENSKIYVNDNTYYQFNKKIEFEPIIIDENKYYFEFQDKLVYILKEEILEEVQIDDKEKANQIAVLNYHYVLNSNNPDEIKECKQAICTLDTQYEEQLKYLKDNNFYTSTMKEFELWFDGKINLPKKTVLITIDDGWYVSRNIELLEKYDLYATLFLIGSLAPPENYKSNNLEIHSHGFNIHNIGDCPGGLGGAILCKDRDYLLSDLKKSRESLNNTPYFCYPFYEYNSYAIGILKEAGFTLAFKGGNIKATRGINRYEIPRYRITNATTLNNFINYVN